MTRLNASAAARLTIWLGHASTEACSANSGSREEDERKSTKKANGSQSSSQSSLTKAKNSEKKYFAVE
ncbi:hypothetical protein E4U32_002045, partial [Claviceps aff. humidiphila group G2b]